MKKYRDKDRENREHNNTCIYIICIYNKSMQTENWGMRLRWKLVFIIFGNRDRFWLTGIIIQLYQTTWVCTIKKYPSPQMNLTTSLHYFILYKSSEYVCECACVCVCVCLCICIICIVYLNIICIELILKYNVLELSKHNLISNHTYTHTHI